MPESTKERGGPERPAEGGRNIRKVPPKSTPESRGFGRQNSLLAPQLTPVAGRESPSYKRRAGEVPEWSIGTVSKTVVRASVPWVRIPPSPPSFASREQGKARGHNELCSRRQAEPLLIFPIDHDAAYLTDNGARWRLRPDYIRRHSDALWGDLMSLMK